MKLMTKTMFFNFGTFGNYGDYGNRHGSFF